MCAYWVPDRGWASYRLDHNSQCRAVGGAWGRLGNGTGVPGREREAMSH